MSRPTLAALALAALLLGACSDDGGGVATDPSGAGSTELVGVLGIDPGVCDGGDLGGSYFRMVQPGGTVAAGPFVSNPDSSCASLEVTAIRPGTEGGLRLGDYQPQPEPNFLDDGTSAAGAVIDPQGFFAVRFGISTNPVDPQSGDQVAAPTGTASDGALNVDTSAFVVSWNGQYFTQGSPDATGTYDEGTGAYALDWTTTVEGGPFNGFTGVWHLAGTFTPA